MKRQAQLYLFYCTLFSALSITSTATQAQELNNNTLTQLGSASDLRITPRIGVGYNTSGAGYDGFTRFEGFVPLLQTPGSTLTFLQGQLLLDNASHLGGSIMLGHRFYNLDANRIFGGYLAYDNRNTGKTTFHQLGIGVESVGTIWDFRLNGYIPIGDTRQVVEERIFDTGLQLTNLFFQDHFLVQQAQRERQEVRYLEAAMAGVDVEAGARLAQWGTDGELRAYGGLYYYDAAGTEGSLGWRVRLDIRPTNSLNFGLAFQEDELFGTNVLFSVGATLGGRRYSEESDSNSVWARMDESVMRTATITVDGQTEFEETFQEPTTIRATNPLTGKPYFFQQVNLQSTGGNGTAENPFGTIAAALNEAQTDHIVYVQGTTAPEIPGFTIPDGVSVLSTAPVQEIDTVTFGRVSLPQSGSGTIPSVRGTVNMGNDTVLSGFSITSDNSSGIRATNISNAEIRESQVTTAATGIAGIFIENSTGTILLSEVEINSTAGAVIEANTINTLEVKNSTLTSSNSDTNGITFDGVSGAVNISDSAITVTNPIEQGIAVANVSGEINIAANEGSQITTGLAGTSGISVQDTTGSVRLSGFDITSTVGAVIEGNTINNLEISNSSLTSINSNKSGLNFNEVNGVVTISDSTITVTNPNQNGIAATNISGTLNITANEGSQITTASDGVAGILVENSTGAVALSGLEISSTGGSAFQGNQVNNVAIANSTLTSSNSTTGGISLQGVAGTVEITDSTITITDPVNNTNGISLSDVMGTVTIAANQGSEITAPNFGIELTNSPTGVFDISGLTITDSQDSGIFGQNLGGVTFQGNTIRQATNQGIALNNVDGTVAIAGNTITNTGSDRTIQLPNGDTMSTGQGIAFANTTGQVDLTISDNNQISDNFNDAILLSFSGDAVASNVTIAGNTLENNGGTSPVRGDGIAIALDNNAIVDNLMISDNKLQGNGDEGIDIRLGSFGISNARLKNGIISNNIIEDNNQIGINILTANGATQQLTITQNIINNSGQEGINILAAESANQKLTISENEINDSRGQSIFIQTLVNSQTVADIQGNTLSNSGSGIVDFRANSIAPNSTFCLNLKDNTSLPNVFNINYELNNFGATFLVVDLANINLNNTPNGSVTFPAAPLGNLTTLTACP
ncbi:MULTISPECIES: beta strand repeat-containing protein [unclassified Coleofasciculus]|uniref:beta strand repeat-containing protein n=1 Tax=unclassified Coleofasciculus TaxID=2692782 RepID=UPI00187FAAFA|nr:MULTISPECIES: right-handed parallel beta-helix repeat-containing protein [unclassified Coleofasciculus]MBE9129521.1 right-handed parallel beta-helix repeat-containing protein [Coleofasciculus sp. LEGE 07081]MBE9151364.1 right-handed parallel beta-helix repeat-containing protein [Coleofasciculus sp. LEGE 07092]